MTDEGAGGQQRVAGCVNRESDLVQVVRAALRELVDRGDQPAINPLIYAEVAAGFETREQIEAALTPPASVVELRRLDLPWNAAFEAGQAYRQYRRQEGTKRSPQPDFYIGPHAKVQAMPVLTRDVNRYRTYFPEIVLIYPE